MVGERVAPPTYAWLCPIDKAREVVTKTRWATNTEKSRRCNQNQVFTFRHINTTCANEATAPGDRGLIDDGMIDSVPKNKMGFKWYRNEA